jgi:4-coumarate--CoA ligase
LTETSPATHLLPPEHALRKIGSIGVLLPNLEARLVANDDDTIADAAPGEPGELWVRGPTVMKGYLNNPTATANSITADGWFKTGDVAIRDDEGYYKIVDRKKELIKYKVCLRLYFQFILCNP